MEDLRNDWQNNRCVTDEERERFNMMLASLQTNAWQELEDTILEMRCNINTILKRKRNKKPHSRVFVRVKSD